MFVAILRMEYDKVFKRKLPWLGMIIALFGFLLFFFMIFDVMHLSQAMPIFLWPTGILSGTFIMASTLPITSIGLFVALVVVAGSTAQEYGWHSLQLWLCQGVGRPTLFFAKVLICCLTVLAITLVAMIAGVLVSITATLQMNLSIDVTRFDIIQFLLAWLRLSYALLPYSMFAFMLAILSRSVIPAISIGLGVAAIAEMLMWPLSRLSPVFRQIWSFMPQALANSLNQLNFTQIHDPALVQALAGTLPVTDPIAANLAIAFYILLFLSIAYIVFVRQNMNG